MANTTQTVAVLGPLEVADSIRSTDQFTVLHAGSTSGFAALIKGDLGHTPKSDVVYLIADNLTLDSGSLTMERLVERLSTSNHHVVILGYTPKARDLADAYTAADLLQGPFDTNLLLAAVAGKTGWKVSPTSEAASETTPAPVSTFATFPSLGPVPTPEPVRPVSPPTFAPAPRAPEAPATFGPPPTQDTPPATFGPPPTQDTPPATFGPPPTQDTPPATFGPPAQAPFGPGTPSGSAPPAGSPFGSFSFTPANDPSQGSGGSPSSDFGPLLPIGSPGQRGQYIPGGDPRGARKSIVVAIAAPKGGVGKTTVTVNLAAYAGLKLLSQGKKVAIVDANFQQADIGKILGKYQPTINDLARDAVYQTPSQIQQHMARFPDINVDVVIGPNTATEANPTWITTKLYNTVTNSLREIYDIIFIDCPVAEPHHDYFEEYILQQADYLIMPVNPSNVTLQNARAWLGHLGSDPTSGVAYDPSKVGILLNQAQDGVYVDSDTVRQNLPKWRFLAEIKSSKEWIRASNNNELVAVSNYAEVNSAFAKVMFEITGDTTFADDAASLPSTTRKRKSGGLLSKLLGGRTK